MPIQDTFKHMMEICDVRKLSDLARVLEIKPQTLNSHKKAGRLPDKLVIRFCRKYDVSVDSLLAGDTPVLHAECEDFEATNKEKNEMIDRLIDQAMHIQRLKIEKAELERRLEKYESPAKKGRGR